MQMAQESIKNFPEYTGNTLVGTTLFPFQPFETQINVHLPFPLFPVTQNTIESKEFSAVFKSGTSLLLWNKVQIIPATQ